MVGGASNPVGGSEKRYDYPAKVSCVSKCFDFPERFENGFIRTQNARISSRRSVPKRLKTCRGYVCRRVILFGPSGKVMLDAS